MGAWLIGDRRIRPVPPCSFEPVLNDLSTLQHRRAIDMLQQYPRPAPVAFADRHLVALSEEEVVKPENERIRELRGLLSGLLDKDVSTGDRLRDWYVDARHVQDALISVDGLGPFVPELVWHYLVDADIRAKDSAYREQQEALLRSFVALLEKDKIPDEASVRLHAMPGGDATISTGRR